MQKWLNQMPFGLLRRVDPRNNTLNEGADAPMEGDRFRGVSGPLQSIGFGGMVKGWTDFNDLHVL